MIRGCGQGPACCGSARGDASEAELVGATHRGASVVDPELGVDVLGVGAHRAQGDAELARDGRPVEVRPEQPHDLELSLAERLDVRGV